MDYPMNDFNGINAEKLKEWRERMNLSQNALDKLAGVGNKTTRNAEGGKGITVGSLLKLSKALGVPPAIFLD
jgi:transcriptional regulator with XRE-family HTH domain